jgi:hypothetical protein
MASTVIQGKLTHVQQTTETHGQISRGSGQITSANAWSFRVDSRAATFKSRGGASLSDGDLVTVAGHDSKGTFQVLALRNDTTGSVHEGPATMLLIGGGVVAVLGVPMMAILIGFLFVPLGLYLLWLGAKLRSANLALAATPIQKVN